MFKQTTQHTTQRNHHTSHLPLLWLILFSLLSTSVASVPTQWKWGHPYPHGNQHNSVIWGDSEFIAVGVGGNIVTSPDGAVDSWVLKTTPSSANLSDVAWSGSRYVTVGDFGVIMSSTDGDKWTIHASATEHRLTSVIWVEMVPATDSFFLATGEHTTAIIDPFSEAPVNRPTAITLTSPDGTGWTLHEPTLNPDRYSAIPPPRLNGITWDGTRFVASSDDGAILTSDDGIAWQTRTINDIAWNGSDLFLAVGDSGLALSSPDGRTWTYRATGTTDNLYGVTWSSTTFITVGENGTALATSDGVGWTPETTNTGETLHSITNFAASDFIAVGNNGTILQRTGSTWTPRVSGTTEDLLGAVWGTAPLVTVGKNGTVLFSNNGTSWSAPDAADFPTNFATDLLGVSWSNGSFIATGKNGVLLTAGSTGDVWTERTTSLSGEWLQDSAWLSPNYIAVGSNGTIITSPDLTTWSSQTANTSENLVSITTDNTSLLISGEYATQITTTDPTAIVLADLDMISDPGAIPVTSGRVTQQSLNDILFSNNRYIAIGNAQTIITSNDLVYWTLPNTIPAGSDNLHNITQDSETNELLIAGEWGTFLRDNSSTGTSWDVKTTLTLPTATTNFLYGVASSASTTASTLVTVGTGGAIYTSNDNSASWTASAGPTQTTEDINGLIATDSLLIAVGNNGTILNSTNGGVDWTSQTAFSCTSAHLHDVAWKSTAPTRFAAVGDAGTVCLSDDGSTWNTVSATTPPNSSSPLYSVVWGGDKFIAVGGTASDSTIYTSPDGLVWTLRYSGQPHTLRDISWNGELFFAVGDSGTVISSPEGITWTRNSTGTSVDLRAITSSDVVSVASGTVTLPLSSTILTNPTGAWQGGDSEGVKSRSINSLAFGGTQFAAVTPTGSILFSSDARDWKEVTTGTNTLFKAITWDGGKFIAAGAGGHILYASNPDLIITGGFLLDSARDGDTLRYRFNVTNRGLSTARNVSYAEELPSVSVLLSATSTRGSCALGASLVCLLGDMATGESATITVDITVTGIGTLRHIAEVFSDDDDSDQLNNTITTSIDVARSNSDSGGAAVSYWSIIAAVLFLLITNGTGIRRQKGFV